MHDVIVVGLGAMGSASLRAMARAGIRVLGIDRFDPPHPHGSSFGETRATRLGVGEGDVYVPLVRRSHEIWRELEEITGDRLLVQCGFLTIDTSGGVAGLHGTGGFFDQTVAVARRHSIHHEILDGWMIRERFSAFAAPDDARGYFEPEGGYVYVESAIAALLTDARAAGASIHTGETFLGYTEGRDAVVVRTDRAQYHTQRLVLAAGSWLPALTGGGLGAIELRPQQLHWVAPDNLAAFDPAVCPVYLWLHGTGAEDLFYGFPQVGAAREIKVASEQCSRVDANAEAAAAADAAALDELISGHLAGRLAGRMHPLRSAGCRYAVAPDGHFVIGKVPASERVVMISACSGHGFKHAPAIGEMVTAMIQSNAAPPPEFAVDRPELRQESAQSGLLPR